MPALSRSNTRRAKPPPVAAAVSAASAQRLVRRSALVSLASFAALGTALVWWAAASGDVARAAPFVAPLLAGEAAAALLHQLGRPRAATALSLLAACATTIALTLLWDASLGVPAWGLFSGGVAAVALLGCARVADAAVPWRRGEREVLQAGLDRVTFVPQALVLALLGRNEGEDGT